MLYYNIFNNTIKKLLKNVKNKFNNIVYNKYLEKNEGTHALGSILSCLDNSKIYCIQIV